MRNVAVITVIICVAALMFQTTSAVASEFHNRRGLEFRAGFSQYVMDDPNDAVGAYPSSYTVTKTAGSPMLGVSLLYKTTPNFGWNIGYNYLFKSTSKAEGPDTATYEIRGHELFAMGSYYYLINSDFTASAGLGVSGFIGSANHDLTTGAGFTNASGRSLGFLANLALEYALKEHLGLKLGIGYRHALLDQISYRDASDREHTVYYGNRPMELDFSGFYGQLGLCVYFEPATHFKTYGD